MDPRHPEQAITRMWDLMNQYNRTISDMQTATTSAALAELEREGGLVVQEICLVAPRMHEALMQSSRQRRHDISRGILHNSEEAEVGVVSKITGENGHIGMAKPVIEEDLTFEQQHIKYTLELDKELEANKKPRKKTAKKKTTKKAKYND